MRIHFVIEFNFIYWFNAIIFIFFEKKESIHLHRMGDGIGIK